MQTILSNLALFIHGVNRQTISMWWRSRLRPVAKKIGRHARRDPILSVIMIFAMIGPALAISATMSPIKASIGAGGGIGGATSQTAAVPEEPAAVTPSRGSSTIPPGQPAPASEPGATPAVPAPAPTTPTPKIVTGWLPGWDQPTGLKSVTDNPGALSEISPFWYYVSPEGGLTGSTGTGDPAVINAARSQGQKIIPTISNGFKNERVAPVIGNVERRDRMVADIVGLVVQNGYDGIDIDFENVAAENRGSFTGFVQVLGNQLHQQGKILSVTVMPKLSEPGNPSGGGDASQDWPAIAASADQVRIMAYDYHYAGGEPGAVAPGEWVDRLLAYAVTVIPKEKVVLGVPSYGYDWAPTGGKTNGRAILYDKAMGLAAQYGSAVNFDAGAASPGYQYTAGGVLHQVWFENAQSLGVKLDLVNKYGVGGIAIWRLGREDPANWQVIREKMGR